MGLGRHALGQGQFHRRQHGLFVVLENQGKDERIAPFSAWVNLRMGLHLATLTHRYAGRFHPVDCIHYLDELRS